MLGMSVETTPAAASEPAGATEGVRIRAFEALANNTARAVTYLLTTLNAPEAMTAPEMGRRLVMLQGPNPGWAPEDGGSFESVPRVACRAMERCGLVEAAEVKGFGGKDVRAVRAAGDEMDKNIAKAGATLDWELQFPETRAFDLLGDSRLNADQAMSLNSFDIYRALLDVPGGVASHLQLETLTGRPRHTIHRTLRFLLSAGGVRKLTKARLADRLISLEDTRPAYGQQYGHRMSRANRALHETVQAMREE